MLLRVRFLSVINGEVRKMGEKRRKSRLQLSVTIKAETVREIKRLSKILGIPQSRIVEMCLKHGEKGLQALREAAKVLREEEREKK